MENNGNIDYAAKNLFEGIAIKSKYLSAWICCGRVAEVANKMDENGYRLFKCSEPDRKYEMFCIFERRK